MESIARMFLILGLIFFVLGGLFYLLSSHQFPFLKFLGKLPGDIYIEKENFKFYFPITTSILLSILLSMLLYLISRFR
jgi:predicted phosphohydrolase